MARFAGHFCSGPVEAFRLMLCLSRAQNSGLETWVTSSPIFFDVCRADRLPALVDFQKNRERRDRFAPGVPDQERRQLEGDGHGRCRIPMLVAPVKPVLDTRTI
eukprot:s3358_g8.t1